MARRVRDRARAARNEFIAHVFSRSRGDWNGHLTNWISRSGSANNNSILSVGRGAGEEAEEIRSSSNRSAA